MLCVGSGRSVANDGVCTQSMAEEFGEMPGLELSVGVREIDKIVTGAVESRAEGCSVAKVFRMRNKAEIRFAPR